jgi:arylsulfatase
MTTTHPFMATTQPFKRDIVVILCDQLRCDFLSLYGCRAVPTPNLDRLAQRGVVFDRAITASPVCGPARASMMTGLYPTRHGVWKNDLPFRPGLEYLAERMNALGYQTGAFGKLHHTPALDVKGFQHAELMEENRLKQDDHYLQWLQQRHPEVKDIWNTDYTAETMYFRLSAEEHYEHWIASRASEWIQSVPAERPLFAWVSFQGPHTPFNPPREMRGRCDRALLPKVCMDAGRDISPLEQCRRVFDQFTITPPVDPVRDNDAIRASYAEIIAFIDQQIGRILDSLAKAGRLENTTIIFSTDHGDMLGDFGLWGKGALPYSASLNTPLLIAGHPGLAGGSRCDVLTGNIDIPGTVLDIAGDPKPLGVSRSLLTMLLPDTKTRRTVNYSELGDDVKIVENGQHRYCYYPLTGFGELFRLDGLEQARLPIAGNPAHEALEREFLKHLLDFAALNSGVNLKESDADFEPALREGLRDKHPVFRLHDDGSGPALRRLHGLQTRFGTDNRWNEDRKRALREFGLDMD